MIAVAEKLAGRMTQHNRVMLWVRLSNSRQAAYSAAIIGRGFAQAPMAERPVALPPEIREPMRHATSIPTSTAAVRYVRRHDCRSPPFGEGKRVFVVDGAACGRIGTYSLDYDTPSAVDLKFLPL